MTITVIALILAIVIPAIQAARDASRRAECLNRLRQFGVALAAYESSRQHYPGEGCVIGTLQIGSGKESSMLFELMPYMELSSEHAAIRNATRLAPRDPEMQFRIPVFHCPAEQMMTGINYRVCAGNDVYAGDSDVGPRVPVFEGAGAFSVRPGCEPPRASDIRDGLSNTAAMSERTIGQGFSGEFSLDRDIWFSGARRLGWAPGADRNTAVRLCRLDGRDPGMFYTPAAGQDYLALDFSGARYNHVLTPNSSQADCDLGPGQPSADRDPPRIDPFSSGIVSARSYHRDRSVSLLLMDGSTRLISPAISLDVWWAVASRASRDRLDGF